MATGCVVSGLQITSGAQSPEPDGYTAEWKPPKLPAKKVGEFRLVYKKVRPGIVLRLELKKQKQKKQKHVGRWRGVKFSGGREDVDLRRLKK